MILLEAVKHQDLFRLWNIQEKEVTEPLVFSEILKCIVDDSNDWDPGMLDWYHEEEINFDNWKVMKVQVLPMMIKDQG
ncbi:hypothetical protein [Domibacillus mangrovi]|uniref:Uncharacterized protein n=1 Tax=Domibacillus mangrovi TaxID=1714354 RepID=A0A1Q5P3F3_9BACI|nr:hypothetical protein [Domibacillus mangrovi]OKL36774.1 hypothetical protein BLL40_08565 [Domibacillus mangrovi]